ncbi:hypothetical protein FA10DRAFT_303010 [Acaromyces ingoldii]|uniref:C2H2-type domain-containing protein n=1 Tax=Acaromyces ingoldii TaxID=215250 RepID=A0A316YKV4_9BASI|nr:hypothetical protein FA10DRAFT_303010 [Acaromyces ingoldii]PWN89706.1 hypothetical protein FA10DRAFT_303010 [Acaromyces ingoldii]
MKDGSEGLAELVMAAQAYLGQGSVDDGYRYDWQQLGASSNHSKGAGGNSMAWTSEACQQCPPVATATAMAGATMTGCLGAHSHLDPCCIAPCPVASSSGSGSSSSGANSNSNSSGGSGGPLSSSATMIAPSPAAACCGDSAAPATGPLCCAEDQPAQIIECQDEACIDELDCMGHDAPAAAPCDGRPGEQCISVCDGIMAPPASSSSLRPGARRGPSPCANPKQKQHPPSQQLQHLKQHHAEEDSGTSETKCETKYCASCEKADRTDEDARNFSSFQELLDCCCCSDVYLDQCCGVVDGAPVNAAVDGSTASIADDCDECFPLPMTMLPPPPASLQPHHACIDDVMPVQGSPMTTVTASASASASASGSRSRSASLSVFSSSMHNSPATVSSFADAAATAKTEVHPQPQPQSSKHHRRRAGAQLPGSHDDHFFFQQQQQQHDAGPRCLFAHAHSHDETGMCLDPALTLHSSSASLGSSTPAPSSSSSQQQHGLHWSPAGDHVCQWAGCGVRCASVSALAEHVNRAHLVAHASTTEDPHGAQHYAAAQQLLGHTQPSDELAWRCLWDSCSQPTLDGAAVGSSHGVDPAAATDLVLRHILDSHLGVAQEDCSQPDEHGAHTHLPLPMHAKTAKKRGAPQAATRRKKLREIDEKKQDEDGEESEEEQGSAQSKGKEEEEEGEEDDFDEAALAHDCGCPHDGTAGHPCRWEGCARSFGTHDALTAHISTVHIGRGRAQYECRWQGCTRGPERSFSQRQKVMRHVQTHTGDRPFRCTVCARRFSEGNTLAQHMRTHTREKPYVCTHPGCGKAFAVAGSLTIHRRMHTGEKPFECAWCGRRFAESSNLTKHARIHTGEKPFRCPEDGCGRTFSRPDQAARHRKTHERARQRAAAK